MALTHVADRPLVANASAYAARAGGHLKKVPLGTWRTLLTGLALFWICHSLATLVWRVIPAPELPAPPVAATVRAEGGGAGGNVSIDNLQALNLFGAFNAELVVATPTVTEQAPLKLTELNLDLQGIIASDDPKRSSAIIGRGANQSLYKIDDEIEGVRGVKLAEIYDTKVVLNNNGSMEELWLYGENGRKVVSDTPYTPPPAPADNQTATISQDQIQQARNIGDVVRFMVATENGRMIGYKVRPGRKRELFDQVGLKTDDIVVSVNGIEVNEPQKVREVYQALKTATEANLQVMRDGTTQSITITMSAEG